MKNEELKKIIEENLIIEEENGLKTLDLTVLGIDFKDVSIDLKGQKMMYLDLRDNDFEGIYLKTGKNGKTKEELFFKVELDKMFEKCECDCKKD